MDTTLLQPLIDKKKITKQQALDEVCDLPQPRMREDYYDKLEELLGVAVR